MQIILEGLPFTTLFSILEGREGEGVPSCSGQLCRHTPRNTDFILVLDQAMPGLHSPPSDLLVSGIASDGGKNGRVKGWTGQKRTTHPAKPHEISHSASWQILLQPQPQEKNTARQGEGTD